MYDGLCVYHACSIAGRYLPPGSAFAEYVQNKCSQVLKAFHHSREAFKAASVEGPTEAQGAYSLRVTGCLRGRANEQQGPALSPSHGKCSFFFLTGLTMESLLPVLEARGANSVRVTSLLEKRTELSSGFKGHYVGFSVPDKFVVGYCLDFNEFFRCACVCAR